MRDDWENKRKSLKEERVSRNNMTETANDVASATLPTQ